MGGSGREAEQPRRMGGQVKRLAVLGHPVSHSRSPAMQSAALAAMELAGEWSYEAIDMPPEEFAGLTRALPAQGFVGANITIPHKRAALALAGAASDAATEIGAANTLSFAEGEIRAENTDAPGLLAALGFSPAGRRALVLGAGGSARAAAWALAGQGARTEVWNRTAARAEELAASLARTSAGEKGGIAAVSASAVRAGGHEVIVNCTAVGMEDGQDPFALLPIDPEGLGAEVTVVDLVYAGERSALLDEASRRGARVVEGIEVLVRQGAESLRIWTGRAVGEQVVEVMRAAARGRASDG